MKYKNSSITLYFVLLSLLLTIYILGFNNLSFTNSNWLAAHDASTDIISWKFYRDDDWRFPIGSNPNYGMNIGSGIAFSGSIPIMAIIFKFFGFILPDNFHYFGLWIFLCFFLSGFISYLIIYNQTNNISFSLIGSLFFIISPILINRLGFHLSLCAHWLILIGLYLEINKNIINKQIYWVVIICISSLVHFYFTIMLLVIYFSFLINDLKKEYIKKTFIVMSSLIVTMYIIGYFDVPFSDAIALGYGNYSLDIASFFINRTSLVNGSMNWSLFIKDKTEIWSEGFQYLGLGGILLLFYLIYIFITKFKDVTKNKNFIPILLLTVVCFLIAISNKIHLFNNLILEIEIPKTIYGLLSLVRASGRMIWPIYYLIFIIAIIKIYQKFPKKKSFVILILILIIQIADIYPGIKAHFNSQAFVKQKKIDDISFWKKMAKENPILRTTYLDNQSKFLHNLRELLLLREIKKTDISIHGRYNRKQASIARSNLYDQFEKKKIPNGVIFAIDNFNHLRDLHHIFKDENVGFFFRNNNWFVVNGYRDEMTKNDFEMLNNFLPKVLKSNEIFYLDFKNKESIHGLGWTHSNNSKKKGIWSEGNISNILFKLDKKVKDNFNLEIKFNSILTKVDNPIIFEIYLNETSFRKIILKNIQDLNKNSLILKLNKKEFQGNIIHLKFKIKNPVTKLELLKSPDARKLGILIESIKINS